MPPSGAKDDEPDEDGMATQAVARNETSMTTATNLTIRFDDIYDHNGLFLHYAEGSIITSENEIYKCRIIWRELSEEPA